jgi:hypothetical protein
LFEARAAAQGGDPAAAAETPATEATGGAPGAGSVTSSTSVVIRGDHPAAAGLANVWLELRKPLTFLADTTPPAHRASRTVRTATTMKFRSTRTSAAESEQEAAEPGEEGEETA